MKKSIFIILLLGVVLMGSSCEKIPLSEFEDIEFIQTTKVEKHTLESDVGVRADRDWVTPGKNEKPPKKEEKNMTRKVKKSNKRK